MKYTIIIGITFLIISTVAIWFLAGWGIRPVVALSTEVGSVAADNLQYRLDVDGLPSDLRGLGFSLNGFIERLEKAFAREKDFAADAAHELCTPISLLKSNIQSALLGPPESARDRQSLEELLLDVERLEGLASSLLVLAEVESGAMSRAADREKIEIQPLLSSLVVQFEHVARQHDVLLEIGKGQDVTVKANSTALNRVFSNLIDNAIKHNRPGGKVWLSAHQDNDACETWVTDDGPGIPEDDVPHLFERFFRVDKSRSREHGSAGLGLAIARTLCESQGGRIHYKTRPGGGSIFIVRFPQA